MPIHHQSINDPPTHHCKSSNNLTISCHFITANSVPIRQSFTNTITYILELFRQFKNKEINLPRIVEISRHNAISLVYNVPTIEALARRVIGDNMLFLYS